MTQANVQFMVVTLIGLIGIVLVGILYKIVSHALEERTMRLREEAMNPRANRNQIRKNFAEDLEDLDHRAQRALATVRAEMAEGNMAIARQQIAARVDNPETFIALPPVEQLDPMRNKMKPPTLQEVEVKLGEMQRK